MLHHRSFAARAVVAAAVLCATAVTVTMSSGASARNAEPWGRAPTLTPHEWRADIRQLRALVEGEHPDPFHHVSRGRFDAHFDALESSVVTRSAAEVVADLMRGTALLGEVHTGLSMRELDLHALDLGFRGFDDGVFAITADVAHEGVLGARLTAVGDHDVDEALDVLAALLAEEAPGTARHRAVALLNVPYFLTATRLVPRGRPCVYAFEARDGRRFTVSVPIAGGFTPSDARGVHVYDVVEPERIPVALGHPGRHFWFTALDDGRTLYAQYDRVADDDDETVASFTARLLAALEDERVERLVLDVRRNPGGASILSRPLIEGLRGHRLDAFGRLVVLMGRDTGSAAVQLVFALEKCTHAVFIGAPTSQGATFYSDPHAHVLDHSGLRVFIARTAWQMARSGDTRRALEPDVPAVPRFADFLAGRDVALDAARRFDPADHPDLRAQVEARRDDDCDVQYVGRRPEEGAVDPAR